MRVNTSYIRRQFYTACNGILSYSRSLSGRICQSFLLCLPLLSYCVGALDLSATCIRELAVCWNDSFRKIFGYKRYESVKLLQYYCSELPFEYICDLQKWKYVSCTSAVSARFITLYEFKLHTLHSLSLKYGFNNCVVGMNRAVTDYFAYAVLCDS